jgi:ferritin
MLHEKMLTELNRQINEELFSSYLYLSMAAYFEDKSLPGFAHWMRMQVQEELAHAQKFFTYIVERGGRVNLTEIGAPQSDWENTLVIFEETLKHEQHISERINTLTALSLELNDFATNNFLQWFIGEQVEEEATVEDLLGKLRLIDGNPQGLFMLDNELGKRPVPAIVNAPA